MEKINRKNIQFKEFQREVWLLMALQGFVLSGLTEHKLMIKQLELLLTDIVVLKPTACVFILI